MFRCGQWVRHATEDLGTGRVVRIDTSQWLEDEKIHTAVVYGVRWLDLTPANTGNYNAAQLVPAACNVPDFTDREQAEQWMDTQRSGGGWVDAMEQQLVTVAGTLDAAAAGVVSGAEESLRQVACGKAGCGCQDCVRLTQPGGKVEHFGSSACHCKEKDCGCTH